MIQDKIIYCFSIPYYEKDCTGIAYIPFTFVSFLEPSESQEVNKGEQIVGILERG